MYVKLRYYIFMDIHLCLDIPGLRNLWGRILITCSQTISFQLNYCMQNKVSFRALHHFWSQSAPLLTLVNDATYSGSAFRRRRRRRRRHHHHLRPSRPWLVSLVIAFTTALVIV